MRRTLAVLIVLALLGPVHAVDDADRAAIRDVIERQLQAFQRDDAAAAYALAAPRIKEAFSSEERFMEMVRQGYPPVHRFSGYRFGDAQDGPDGMAQSVRIQDRTGVAWVALYTLERQPDGSWKVSGCVLQKAPEESA